MFSALEIFLVMRYINLLFTYLLTYLLTTQTCTNCYVTNSIRGVAGGMHASRAYV